MWLQNEMGKCGGPLKAKLRSLGLDSMFGCMCAKLEKLELWLSVTQECLSLIFPKYDV